MFKQNTEATVTFLLVNSTDGSPTTSGTVTCNVIKDGGVAASATNSPTHRSNGVWALTLTATEMNADNVSLVATETNSVPTLVQIQTVDKLVSDLSDFDPGISGVNVEFVNGNAVTSVDDFKASTTGLSTFDASVDFVTVGTVKSDIRFVNGVAVTNIDEFKADTAGITEAFAGTTVLANVVQVTGTDVTDVEDFHASTAGLSTFDPEVNAVSLKANAITTSQIDVTAISKIADGVLDEQVDGVVDLRTASEMLLAFIAGRVDVTDNGDSRTFSFYRRGGTEISYTITASEIDSIEGQRSSEGTIV